MASASLRSASLVVQATRTRRTVNGSGCILQVVNAVAARVQATGLRCCSSSMAPQQQAMESKPDRSRRLKPELHLKVFQDAGDLSGGLARYVKELSEHFIQERGAFSVVLSGGSLVNALLKLAEQPYADQIDWSRWHVYWVDERVVPKDDPDSSYKLANDLFLSKVPIPAEQVYAISDTVDAERAAEEYETLIREHLKKGIVDVSDHGLPKLDLILLGMGPDGHVASLFPRHQLVKERTKWVASITDSPKPPPKRITFTFPVVNSASNIAFVASGAGKAEMVKLVFGEELPAGELPAQMVFPTNGKLAWFVDTAAASAVNLG